MCNSEWKISKYPSIPAWFLDKIRTYPSAKNGNYIAQILWKREIKTEEELANFLNPNHYKPSSPFEFGEEMKLAIKRLQKAIETQEKVAIWGDFDADGVTSTSVLWEGLGQFFAQNINLTYYIPNRFTESHGLNYQGIDELKKWGVKLIVTCDTGSTNLTEIEYANELGIDLIITDHHTFPKERPAVKSIINPRYLPKNHPLYNLSGVAVAYKLIEALYETFPKIPQQSLDELLDLVAIGLIADLVNLTGDCRYLAQLGIKQLQQTKRLGIRKLLESCKRSGDRPTDISFGIGPRINAVSRINGDAKFCVELLTSKDPKLCHKLASETESANSRRKELEQTVFKEAKKKIEYIDLSTTGVILLHNDQWEIGVLGLVANKIAQEYGRPTILLTTGKNVKKGFNSNNKNIAKIAKGSARSFNKIDLYELIFSQSNLLENFGGHPYAAGLSILIENISFFTESINQKLRQTIDIKNLKKIIEIDLIVKVAELGKDLFKELKLLEPCGMGNPAPKLLIKNCWFDNIWHQNQSDNKGKKVKYIKTYFKIYDKSNKEGFNGIWWGHYQDELIPQKKYDAIVELDFNANKKEYEVRIIDLKLSEIFEKASSFKPMRENDLVLRSKYFEVEKENLINHLSTEQIWQKLVGIIKYLIKKDLTVTKKQLTEELKISDRTLEIGLKMLEKLGFKYEEKAENLDFFKVELNNKETEISEIITDFIEAIKEENFQQEYHHKILKNKA
jgi:single-stranded-DNA-specific exonuclease